MRLKLSPIKASAIKKIMTESPKYKQKLTTVFEVTGSVLAMIYALLIASNTGNEILGFALLFFSASLFAAWAIIDRRELDALCLPPIKGFTPTQIKRIRTQT